MDKPNTDFVVSVDPNATNEEKRFQEAIASSDVVICIVIVTSFIDHVLGKLLTQFFIKSSISENLLKHNGGAIGTFSAKSDLAYCVGLIPKTVYNNLRTLAELRNKVAHRIDNYTFYHEDIATLCNKLKIPKNLYNSLVPLQYGVNTSHPPTSPRVRFYYSLAFTHSWIHTHTTIVQKTQANSTEMWSDCI